MNWDKTLIRCSAISKIMSESRENPPITSIQLQRILELEEKTIRTAKQTEELANLLQKREKSKDVVLSDTCITYLLEVYAWEKYSKEPLNSDKKGKAVEKGKLVEDDSITLLSLVDKKMYVKNTDRFSNEYLSGEPDIISKNKVIDIKSSFDIISFLSVIKKPINPAYKYQVNGYMDILKLNEGEVSSCLVNANRSMINDEMKRLFYKMDVATEENIEYKKAGEQLMKNMTFEDIPMNNRVHKMPVEKIDMEPIYERVYYCRKWLKDFEDVHENLNK